MRKSDIEYKKLVLVCVNERGEGMQSCGAKGSMELYKKLKQAIKELDPEIRVSRSGCLGNCLSGISVVIQPDNIWLGEVREDDIEHIKKILMK